MCVVFIFTITTADTAAETAPTVTTNSASDVYAVAIASSMVALASTVTASRCRRLLVAPAVNAADVAGDISAGDIHTAIAIITTAAIAITAAYVTAIAADAITAAGEVRADCRRSKTAGILEGLVMVHSQPSPSNPILNLHLQLPLSAYIPNHSQPPLSTSAFNLHSPSRANPQSPLVATTRHPTTAVNRHSQSTSLHFNEREQSREGTYAGGGMAGGQAVAATLRSDT